MKLRVLDLFSGIGGFSLGLERTGGFETVAFCEIEEFPRKVLAKHWPEVPIYEDVTTARFESIGPVDVVTGGFPCQDISLAGSGAGLAGDRSGLFWHILRTVCLVGRPKLLLENVAALLDRGLGAVLGALAQIGYDAEWNCIPASYVGAPQLRDRIWITANADEGEMRSWRFAGVQDSQEINWPRLVHARGSRADHAIPDWLDRVGALGNAVVPQIPEMIGHAILEAESTP